MSAWRRTRWLLAFAVLFSGAALLANIIAGISLGAALLAGVLVFGLSVAWAVRSLDGDRRDELLRVSAVGVAAGALGTLAYNVSRAVLSVLDPSPFDPFATIPLFGRLLLGTGTPEPVAVVAGFAFHLLNGISFALAFVFLFGPMAGTLRRSVVAGMGWGLFLETFQLTLYPGWLDITTYREFVQISFLGHFAYGSVLGWTSWVLGRRWFRYNPSA